MELFLGGFISAVRVSRERSAQFRNRSWKLQLASELFAQRSARERKVLVILSDMRQSTPVFELDSTKLAPDYKVNASRLGKAPPLHGAQVYVLGADNAGRTTAYWQSLRHFWINYFAESGAALRVYATLRDSHGICADGDGK
jgi:hypothetical protein